jgi:hypothetical protein
VCRRFWSLSTSLTRDVILTLEPLIRKPLLELEGTTVPDWQVVMEVGGRAAYARERWLSRHRGHDKQV